MIWLQKKMKKGVSHIGGTLAYWVGKGNIFL